MARQKDILTTGEVAKICNVAPRTVSYLVYGDGKAPRNIMQFSFWVPGACGPDLLLI